MINKRIPKKWENSVLDLKITEILSTEAAGKTFKEICMILGVTPTGNNAVPWREVDRCLQRLRKTNKVMFDRQGGWQLKTGIWERLN